VTKVLVFTVTASGTGKIVYIAGQLARDIAKQIFESTQFQLEMWTCHGRGMLAFDKDGRLTQINRTPTSRL